jgi:arylsulfatase A-like enzyme
MHVRSLALLSLIILTLTSHGVSAEAASKRPNILFVLIDDMGYRDLSCFGGNRLKTPEIDRLASEGLRFTQFYVSSPICSSSRVAVTTGQYPNRWAITTYLASHAENRRRRNADWLSVDAPTSARSLAQSGYYTAHVGKWHMGGQRDVGNAPLITEYGFASSLTNFEGLGKRLLPIFEKHTNGKEFIHGPTQMSAKLGGPIKWVERHKVSEHYVDRAIREIEFAQRSNQPFYINLWPDDVHSPVQASSEMRGDGSPEAHYLGVLKELDRQLGRIFNYIRSQPKLRDNTLIVLASDNGHEPGLGSSGSLRGSKGSLYEGGIRSPLIVWGPGRIAPASQPRSSNDRTVIVGMDLPPSLLAIAGVVPPEGVEFDGLDMSAALLGKSVQRRTTPVMWVRPPDRRGPVGARWPDLAIRDGTWKLLVQRDGSAAELYDIVRDPNEENNLASFHSDVARRLSEELLAWDRSISKKAANRPASTAQPAATTSVMAARPPDMVLFIADDLTWHDIGPYGGSDVRTPHLNRLARESLKFDQAFSASPTCTPSRSSMYTGLYPIRNGAHANHSFVREGTPSLPVYLKSLGYRCVLAGKTHIGPRRLFAFEYLKESNVMPPGKTGVLWMDLGVPAIDKLLASHDRRQPLCLIVAAHSPHMNWPENDGYDAAQIKLPPYLLDTLETRNALAKYYTDVTKLDKEVGQVRESLARHGFADALFMFIADQGAQWPFAKWNLYDAGIRVPMLVHWPGKANARTTHAMVSLIDLLPTMIEAAGGVPPADIDGKSFLNVLTKTSEVHRKEIYAAHTGDKSMNQAPMRCVRTERFKYIQNLAPKIKYTTHINKGEDVDIYWNSWVTLARSDAGAAKVVERYEHRPAEELYDIVADPFEMKNLSSDPAHADELSQLREKVNAWRVDQGEDLNHVLVPADAYTGKMRYAD